MFLTNPDIVCAMDVLEARWLLAEISQLPSFDCPLWDDVNNKPSGIAKSPLYPDGNAVARGYLRLANVTPKAFYLALAAERYADYENEVDPDWKPMYSMVDRSPAIVELASYVPTDLRQEQGVRFVALYWLMFEVSDPVAQSPWVFGEREVSFQARGHLSGVSTHAIRIPDLSELLRLKKRDFSLLSKS